MQDPVVSEEGLFLKFENCFSMETCYVRKDLVSVIVGNKSTVIIQGVIGNTLAPLLQAEIVNTSKCTAGSFAESVAVLLNK